jgi:hypothetical protein
MTLEERFAIIESREAIKDLTARYAWHAARAEADEMVALFAPDGHFNSRSAKNITVDKLAEYYREHLRPSGTIPMVHNHIIEIDGDAATGTCVMETPWSPAGPFCGYYQDSFRRIDGRWYFVDRCWNYFLDPEAEQAAGSS